MLKDMVLVLEKQHYVKLCFKQSFNIYKRGFLGVSIFMLLVFIKSFF